MTGPLAVHEAALYAELVRRGYAASSVCDALRTARWLSSWMEHQRLSVAELTPLAVDGFLAARREVCRSEPAARRWRGAVPGSAFGHGGGRGAGRLPSLSAGGAQSGRRVRALLLQPGQDVPGLAAGAVGGGTGAAGCRAGDLLCGPPQRRGHQRVVGQGGGDRAAVAAALSARGRVDPGIAGCRGPGGGRLAAVVAAPRTGPRSGRCAAGGVRHRHGGRRPGPGDLDAAGPAGAARRGGGRAWTG